MIQLFVSQVSGIYCNIQRYVLPMIISRTKHSKRAMRTLYIAGTNHVTCGRLYEIRL